MFCPNCGQQVADGTAFCTVCGTNLAGQMPVQQAQPVMEYAQHNNAVRENELGLLTEVWKYFSQINPKYQEYDDTCKKVNYYARGASSALLVWGCILASIGLLFAIIFSTDYSTQDAVPVFLLLFTLPGVLMITGGILMKVNNRKKYTRYQQQYAQLFQELYYHYAAYTGCPVGMEYTNPDTIAYILKQMQSGRAYTIRDAINLTVSEKASQINRHTEQIRRNTREVNSQGNLPVILPASMFKF